jgi:hypothetical protein
MYALTLLVAICFPGAIVTATAIGWLWHLTAASWPTRLLVTLLSTSSAALVSGMIRTGWPVLIALGGITGSTSGGPSSSVILRSLRAELLLGPLLYVFFHAGTELRSRTMFGQIEKAHRSAMTRAKALQPGWEGPGKPGKSNVDMTHPADAIRLGVDETGFVFDLAENEIEQHIFIPGASGSGKTTTLMRLAGGALTNGYGIAIVDCKGVGLGGDARRLAAAHGVKFINIDPDDKKSIGYDICTGDAADVANKLIGAFEFSGEAEIYKQVAMEVVPLIARALVASDQPVTLDAIYEALGKGGLARLGRAKGAEAYRDILGDLDESGGVGTAGYVGLQRRLGALLQGKFGDIFRRKPALDWDKVTSKPNVTYLSLSATAASEDVELFGRVVTQDLKQLCARRLRAIDRGKTVAPLLVIYDEFAALREARQVEDLLLQARQARMSIVVSTQYLPEEITLLRPVLQAGVLIAHRVGAEDAEVLANELGTHKVPFATAQVDFGTGVSEKGSVRVVDEYNVHPNTFRQLPIGVAVVYARRSARRTVVRIHRDEL